MTIDPVQFDPLMELLTQIHEVSHYNAMSSMALIGTLLACTVIIVLAVMLRW